MHEITLLGYHETVIPECFILKHIMTWGQILKNSCAQLLHLAPIFKTAFSSNEVERQKHFLALNFFTRKSSQKIGRRAQLLSARIKKLIPGGTNPSKAKIMNN